LGLDRALCDSAEDPEIREPRRGPIPAIEQHVDWIADCLVFVRERGYAWIEASPTAVEDWVAHVNEIAGRTLYPTCNSWYLGANIPGKPRAFMPYLGFPACKQKCDEVAANDYEGFCFD
jgi:cyclohexanone monooxygenase